MLMHAIAHDPFLHQEIEPASTAFWSDALPTELHPYPDLDLQGGPKRWV